MKLLWYNSESDFYQWGTRQEYAQVKVACVNPENILVLERFTNTSKKVLSKIAKELNKCRA